MSTAKPPDDAPLLPMYVPGPDREKIQQYVNGLLATLAPYLSGSPEAMAQALGVFREQMENQFASQVVAHRDQLTRLARALDRIHPQEGAPRSAVTRSKRPSGPPPSIGEMFAEIRTTTEFCHDVVGRATTANSSGVKPSRFRGVEHISRKTGEMIYADLLSIGIEEVYKKWCFNITVNRFGVVGGMGNYTKSQVAATVSHRTGRHRARSQKAAQQREETPS